MKLKQFISALLAAVTIGSTNGMPLNIQTAYASEQTDTQAFDEKTRILKDLCDAYGINYDALVQGNSLYLFVKESMSNSLINTLINNNKISVFTKEDQNNVMSQYYAMAINMVNRGDVTVLKSLLMSNDTDSKVIDAYQKLFNNLSNYSNDAFIALTKFQFSWGTVDGVNMGMATDGTNILLSLATIDKINRLQMAGLIGEFEASKAVASLFETNVDPALAMFIYRTVKGNCDYQAFITKCEQNMDPSTLNAVSDPNATPDILVIEQPIVETPAIEAPVVEVPVVVEQPPVVVEAPVVVEQPPVVVEAPVVVEQSPVVVEAPVVVEQNTPDVNTSQGYSYDECREAIGGPMGINEMAGFGGVAMYDGDAEALAYALMDLNEDARITLGNMGLTNSNDVASKIYGLIDRVMESYKTGNLSFSFPDFRYLKQADHDLFAEIEQAVNDVVVGYKETCPYVGSLVGKVTDPNQMTSVSPGSQLTATYLLQKVIEYGMEKGLISSDKGNGYLQQLRDASLSQKFFDFNDRYSSGKVNTMQMWATRQYTYDHLA